MLVTGILMPRYGFNFLWAFSKGIKPPRNVMRRPNLRQLDLLVDMGLDFVRIPLDYRFWTTNFDYLHPDETILGMIDQYLAACRERGLHMCLNLHRAPGYCINGLHLERDRLWTDAVAQDAFVFLWEKFARKYRDVSNDWISFDLVNEPSETPIDRIGHEKIMRRTVAAIRQIHPDREIVLDGWNGGHIAMPELADLGVIQSGRGYYPFPISHYKARWWSGHKGLPKPIYPGTPFEGKIWDKDTLREFYQPWRDLEAKGTKVHIGEFGCYNKTPQDVALRWFADLLSLYREFGWGYSLWNFRGPFGIINHGRPGAKYEKWRGYKVDRALLDLYLENRVQ